MQIQLNQQQVWLAERAAKAEGYEGDLDQYLTDVVRRYLAASDDMSSDT